jgi:hypothetical protein
MDSPSKPQQVLLRTRSDIGIVHVPAGAPLTGHVTPVRDGIQVQICADDGTPIAQLLLVLPDPSQRETGISTQPIYPN